MFLLRGVVFSHEAVRDWEAKRGAEIRCAKGSHVCALFMEGHPLDGMTFGAPGTITHLVGRWVENARREANTMTEAEARAALRAFGGGGEVEPWIAGQPWKAESGGWFVLGELHGSHFHLEVMAGGVRVIASRGGGRESAVWSVPRLPRQ